MAEAALLAISALDADERPAARRELEPAEPVSPVRTGHESASLGEVFMVWKSLLSAKIAAESLEELSERDPSAVVAGLLVQPHVGEGVVPVLERLAQAVGGQPSGGIAFLLRSLRARVDSEPLRRAIASFERHVQMPPTAQKLERFLANQQVGGGADPLNELRAAERAVDTAYDAVDAARAGAAATRERDLATALAALEDALAREAVAAQAVLDRRMPSLERAADAAKRAKELIARYAPDAS